jgi:hypothetical protein
VCPLSSYALKVGRDVVVHVMLLRESNKQLFLTSVDSFRVPEQQSVATTVPFGRSKVIPTPSMLKVTRRPP